jgi:hypothetical protein
MAEVCRRRHLGAWMHAEHGLGLHVFTLIQRSAPTNSDQQPLWR